MCKGQHEQTPSGMLVSVNTSSYSCPVATSVNVNYRVVAVDVAVDVAGIMGIPVLANVVSRGPARAVGPGRGWRRLRHVIVKVCLSCSAR